MQSVFIKNKKPKKITVSINTFIQKPSTPFQWSAMEGIDEIKRKRKFLQKGLKKISGIQIIAKSSKEEILQAVFSLGDRKVGLAIYDKLSRQLDWQQAWERAKINVEQTIMASKNYEAKFPWDFIDSGFRKENLWKLWQQSKE